MTDRRIRGARAHSRAFAHLCRARRFVRLFSLLLVSVIGLGVAQPAGDTTMEEDTDRDERIVFRHFV